MVGCAVVCCGNMMDELESGYFDREYSLTKPYAGQNWDMGGMTVVTPDYVRLTQDRQSTRGSIWNRVPVRFHNWELVVQFAVHGSGDLLFGDGFAFWYTKDKGMDGPVFGSRDYFSGLGIFFDTYSNHNGPHDHEHPFISAMVNNGTLHYDHDRDGTHSQISGCHCEFRAQQHSTYAIISYMDGVLAVHTSVDGTDDWNECFVVDNINLPTGYYMGFTAATGELADNHDIISVRVFDVDKEAGGGEEDWATVSPDARSAEAPRSHVPDAGSHMGPRSQMLYLTVIVLLLVVVVGGGVGYFLYSRKKEKERKRFY